MHAWFIKERKLKKKQRKRERGRDEEKGGQIIGKEDQMNGIKTFIRKKRKSVKRRDKRKERKTNLKRRIIN